jgi:hypothetical protein
MFNPQPNRGQGFDKYGKPVGFGQMREGNPYLDMSREEQRGQKIAPQQGGPDPRIAAALAAAGGITLPTANRAPKNIQAALGMSGMGSAMAGSMGGVPKQGFAPPPAESMPGAGVGGAISAATSGLAGGNTVPQMSGNGLDARSALQWGGVGQMGGFEVGNDYGGDAKAANSMKNTFGRLASQFGSSPEALRQLVASEQFKQFFPQARLLDHPTDPKIDFGGMLSDFESGVPVGVVDVLNKSGQGGWQWLDEANDMGMGGGAAMAPMGGGMPAGGGNQQNILRALMGDVATQQSNISIDQILQALLQGQGGGGSVSPDLQQLF